MASEFDAIEAVGLNASHKSNVYQHGQGSGYVGKYLKAAPIIQVALNEVKVKIFDANIVTFYCFWSWTSD